MSAQTVQQLENLLARVQERRHQPRPLRVAPDAAASSSNEDLDVATLPPSELEEASPSLSPEPMADEASFGDLASQPPAPSAAASIEAAAERRAANIADSHPASAAPSAPPVVEGAPPVSEAPAPAPSEAPARTNSQEPSTGVVTGPGMRVAHEVPQATGPVALEEGAAPEVSVPSFAALIGRSLSLRAKG